jgi:hypothetical protein
MPCDDLDSEMERTLTGVEVSDRIVSGHPAAAELPDGLERVAAVLAAARSAPEPGELARETDTVAAMAALVRSSPVTTPASTRRKRFMLIHPLRLRTAAIFAALVFASTGGLAAAGALPGPAQDVVSTILSELGLSLPDQAGGEPETARPSQSEKGLAIAALASGSDERSLERGALISALASDGKSRAGANGQPADAGGAPVSTPNEGGTPTADTASGGASEPGTTMADAQSGGASAAGSGNADVAAGGAQTGLGTASDAAGGTGLSVAPPPPAP